MKTIYFVRHGQSEGNIGPIRQLGTASLTEKGKEQARMIAQRVSRLEPEILISSSMNRAMETAQIIIEHISLPVEHSELFIERRRPKEQLGVAKNDPGALEAERAIYEHFADEGFRFSDEENFDDLKERARKALKYLASRPEEKLIVITHGFFMRIIAAYVTHGENLTGAECEQFIRKLHMENTGLTVLGYGSDDEETPEDWWVWVWNDHAHLG